MTQIWLAVDKSKSEYLYDYIPSRSKKWNVWETQNSDEHMIKLPKGTIKKIIGRKLTWADEAVMVVGK